MTIEVVYHDNRGRDVIRSVYSEPHLKEMLGQIRTKAKVYLLTKGKWEVVGGVEPIDGADDRRVKWNWWYDSVVVMKFFESISG